MPARRNTIPSLEDSFSRLADSLKNGVTTPTGIQSVGPGEGFALQSAGGGEIFWDYEEAKSFSDRIDAGAAAIELGRLDLDQARLDLDAAAVRISSAESELTSLDSALTTAQSTISSTVQGLSSLETAVGDVSSAVTAADQKAAAAQAAATAAQADSSQAMSQYDALRVKLDAALAAKPGLLEDSGVELPEKWQGSYGAAVIVSSAARSGSRVLNLPWENTAPPPLKLVHAYSKQDITVVKDHVYRLTAYLYSSGPVASDAAMNFLLRRGAAGTNTYIGNTTVTPLTAVGVTQGAWRVVQVDWTAPESYDVQFGIQARSLTSNLYVDDFQVVDSTQEAALQVAVEDARQKAQDAAAKALAAMTAAGQAQASADGKSTVTSTVNTPSGVGLVVGDLHFQMSSLGSGGAVVRQWRWNGTVWVETKIGSEAIAALDVGKLTGVFANISQHLQAGSIGADKLLIGLGDNLAPDPEFRTPQAWNMPEWVKPTEAGYRNNGVLEIPPGTTQRGAYMSTHGALPASRRVRFSVWVKSSKALPVGGIRVFVRAYLADGSWVFGTPTYVGLDTAIPAGEWGQMRGEFSAPEAGATFILGLFAHTSATGTVKFSSFQANALTEGALIVNGSITGREIDAASVSAKVVSAMTLEARKGIFTDGLTAVDSNLLGTTVADSLKTNKLVARDVVAAGTVDLAQLNVTGTMSAEIARFMDTTAKRLIVTDDAILNRATIVKSLVTPELISDKIQAQTVGAKLMSANALESVSSHGTVRMNSAGLFAWDAAGELTVSLGTGYNFLTGDLQTAVSGTRARISTRDILSAIDFFAGGQADHGGMWYQGGTTKAMTLGAMPDDGFDPKTSASMTFWGKTRSVSINAMMGNSPGHQHGYFSWGGSGIPANGSSGEVWRQYYSPLAPGSKVFLYFQAETRSGARVIVTQTSVDDEGFSFVVNNLSNFNTGLIYIWWTAVARTRWW